MKRPKPELGPRQKCHGCRRTKPLDEYPRVNSKMQERSRWCDVCTEKARDRKRREEGALDYRQYVAEQARREAERAAACPRTQAAYAALRESREAASR